MKTQELEKKLGYEFKNKNLLTHSLTHKSYAYENSSSHNEKLEFLGDAVLDLILSEYLMEVFPDHDEGPLSKLRALLVSESGLSLVATQIGLSEYLILGKGEIHTGGAQKPRLLASSLEALLGAVFADCGYEKTKSVVRPLFYERFQEIKNNLTQDIDYKSQLQELVQAKLKITPVYEVINMSGPAHEREFEMNVKIDKEILAIGSGKSKKAAEQSAAQKGIEVWNQRGEQ